MGNKKQEKPRLLVVDDEPEFCDFVGDVAAGVGYEVVETYDAEQVPLLLSGGFDVIVLDLAMPRMDGIELIRFLAGNRIEASIILISGFDVGVLNSARDLATELGLRVLGTATKPVGVDELEALLIDTSATTGRFPPQGSDELPSVDELRQAFKNSELTVFYQPKIDMRTRSVAGVEALARWQHPVKGTIPPSMFVPFAEENGLIDELTTVVTRQALEQCGVLAAAGIRIQVSVNTSARTLTNLQYPDELIALVAEKGLDPSQLIVEVTESALVEELTKSLDVLTRLRLKGVHLSIDDFGTGYSSMQQLQRVPFTELKVDQSFVAQADIDRGCRSIVKTTIQLGHRLGMKVVAEGVETDSIWDLLAGFGCDQVQGYLMAKPMPGESLIEWIRDYS